MGADPTRETAVRMPPLPVAVRKRPHAWAALSCMAPSQGMAWRDNAMTMATWRIAGCWQTGVAARALGDVNDARRRALSLCAMAPARRTERLSQDNTGSLKLG